MVMVSLSVSTLYTLDYIRNTSTSEGMTVQSAAVFGAVGGALSVVMVAIVLIVVVTAVMIVTKRRKSNHQDAAGKGTCIVDVIYNRDSNHS